MADNVLFAESGIVVSQTRLVIDGDTYAMASISSCNRRYSDHVDIDGGKKFLRSLASIGSLVGGIALAIFLSLGGGVVIGIAVGGVLGIGGFIAANLFIDPERPYQLHHVNVGTNSGPMTVVETTNLDFAKRVERAINDAIVARG